MLTLAKNFTGSKNSFKVFKKRLLDLINLFSYRTNERYRKKNEKNKKR